MAGQRGGAAAKTKQGKGAEVEPVYHWLDLGDHGKFAMKMPVPTYLLGKLFAAKSLGDILELQAKALLAAVDDSDREALDELLESGAVPPDEAIDALLAGYSERPTKRPGSTSGGASSEATTSPTSSPSSEPGAADAGAGQDSSPDAA